MVDLTQDEFTILLIADRGEFMAPIGRWKAPILSLLEKGLMQRLDDVNYTITDAGRAARATQDEEDDTAIRDALSRRQKAVAAEPEEDSEGPLLAEELKDG